MAAGKTYEKVIKPYEAFIKNLGYQVFYNGCSPDNSEVFIVFYIPNPDNENEFQLAFYQIFTDAPLSMEGFMNRVVAKGDKEQFAKDVVNRIKGCTISKTDAVFCLLNTRKYTIDEVYPKGNLKLTPAMMKEISFWVNFKGGRNPMTREQVRKRMES